MATPVNIQIPPGSVPQLEDAAGWHSRIADTLDQSQKVLVSNSFTLATRWEGVAAATYADYSRHVEASYAGAADQARDIARKLEHWAAELEDDQRRSTALLTQARDVAKQIDLAKHSLASHQSALTRYDGMQSAADHAGDPAVGYATQISACQSAVSADQAQIKRLEEQLRTLETQAAKIYESAEELAASTNRYLNSVSVTPPPLLHAAAAPAPNQVQNASVPQYAAGAAGAAGAGAVMNSGAVDTPDDPGAVSGASVTVPPVVSGPIPKRVEAMVKQADALLGLPYVWGGGHNGWGPQSGYDCSGFVSKVLHAGGLLSSPQTTTGLAGQPGIANGRGRYVTIFDRTDAGSGQDHVIIDINGQFYESGGQAGPWGGGGGVMKISPPSSAYLSSFNRVLHPVGM